MQYGPSAHLLLCSVTHCLQLRPARSATRLTTISISLSGLPRPLGKTSWFGVALRASFRFLKRSIKPDGSGTTRSSQFFGVKRQCGFAFTRTSWLRKSMSFHST